MKGTLAAALWSVLLCNALPANEPTGTDSKASTSEWLSLDRELARASPRLEPVRLNQDSHAIIAHTSGTTGFPKGVLHTSRTLMHGIKMILPSLMLPRHIRAAAALPYNHLIAHTGLYAAMLRNIPLWTVTGFDPKAFLELEEDAHPREVHAQVLGQVPDPEDAAEIVLRVQADVRTSAGRTDEPLALVDAERPGMDADQLGGHADDVDRPAGVPPRTLALLLARGLCHAVSPRSRTPTRSWRMRSPRERSPR